MSDFDGENFRTGYNKLASMAWMLFDVENLNYTNSSAVCSVTVVPSAAPISSPQTLVYISAAAVT